MKPSWPPARITFGLPVLALLAAWAVQARSRLWPVYDAAVAIPALALAVMVAYLACLTVYQKWSGILADIRPAYPARNTAVEKATATDGRVGGVVFARDVETTPMHRTAMRQNLLVFAQLGDDHGFKVRDLQPKYVSRDVYDYYVPIMVGQGALTKTPFTQWAAGMDLAAYREGLRSHEIPCPTPDKAPVPVRWHAGAQGRTDTQSAQENK